MMVMALPGLDFWNASDPTASLAKLQSDISSIYYLPSSPGHQLKHILWISFKTLFCCFVFYVFLFMNHQSGTGVVVTDREGCARRKDVDFLFLKTRISLLHTQPPSTLPPWLLPAHKSARTSFSALDSSRFS